LSRAEETYEKFSRFYDRYWGGAFHGPALRALEKLLFPGLFPGSAVLDLCCGAGHLAYAVAEKGFGIIGVDISGDMLNYARRRVPGARFIQADARNFRVPRRCDGAFSAFESLNHIPDMDGFTLVLKCLGAALVPGAVFVFDLNTEEAYLTSWGKECAIVEDDDACIVRGGYSPGEKTAWTDITLFHRGGAGWDRSDVRISQKCHAPDEVMKALEKNGFHSVSLHKADREFGMGEDLGKGRIFVRSVYGGKLLAERT